MLSTITLNLIARDLMKKFLCDREGHRPIRLPSLNKRHSIYICPICLRMWDKEPEDYRRNKRRYHERKGFEYINRYWRVKC